MRKQRGFTLVEFLVVIAILGFLAAILIPAFMRARENQSQQEQGTGEQAVPESTVKYEVRVRHEGDIRVVEVEVPSNIYRTEFEFDPMPDGSFWLSIQETWMTLPEKWHYEEVGEGNYALTEKIVFKQISK